MDKRIMRVFVVLLLSFAMLCSCSKTSSVDESVKSAVPDMTETEEPTQEILLKEEKIFPQQQNSEEYAAALRLNELGLFNGVGKNADGTPNFDLGRVPTRAEAATLLVRIFGDEEIVLREYEWGEYVCPFTDVAKWERPYVAYAYERGIVQGQSATTFGGDSPVTASEYLTFILRAMGYESGINFQWNRAWELSDYLGITDGRYNENTNDAFTRGDVAIVSLNVLRVHQPIVVASANIEGLDVVASYNPEGQSWDGFLLTPVDTIHNLCIVELNGVNANYQSIIGNTLLNVGDVLPGQAVQVVLTTGDTYPLWGITLTDSNGKTRGFYLYESMRDGSVGLSENIYFPEPVQAYYSGKEPSGSNVIARYDDLDGYYYPQGINVVIAASVPLYDFRVVGISVDEDALSNGDDDSLYYIERTLYDVGSLYPGEAISARVPVEAGLFSVWGIIYTDEAGVIHALSTFDEGGNMGYDEFLEICGREPGIGLSEDVQIEQ